MRIAYVEDNATNLALVERVAGMNRHTVVSYAEGEIAIEELLVEPFDLILMDVELAGEMGGLQVVRHLRQAGLKTPIIAVTAYAMLGDRERCLEAGCNGYLPKPLPIADLLVLLARYDAESQAQPEPVAASMVNVPKAKTVPPAASALGAPTTPISISPVTPVPPSAPNVNAGPTPVTPVPPSAQGVNTAPSVSVQPVPPVTPTEAKPAPKPNADAATSPRPGSDKPAQSNEVTPDHRVP